ncbi:GH35 family endo-1,4-beta-xylanase [Paenibacillus taihuensis]|uniref:Beta-xylanase n=1 Tax=Paenibacillus taihuensis TaxID=1156355 RepID=A0A3D9RK87_9BACL|nr:endo-1,4-beta-xylanase [Paenibacillus taihuensis]REE80157.1 GH35 family endo-1,4-beta-xylanase [Paenibacillus taihuensis]
MNRRFKKIIMLLLAAALFVPQLWSAPSAEAADNSNGSTVVWSIDANQLVVPGTTGNDQYLGNGNYQPGVQLADTGSSKMAMYADGSLGINPSGGTYKAINIQTGTAVGGTNYYTNSGFVAEANKTYTITFNAYVADGTGQVRARGNNSGDWASTSISTTPTPVTYTWTQAATGGNLQIDTGSTAQDTVVYITDMQITTPSTDDSGGTTEPGTTVYDMQTDAALANGWGSSTVLKQAGVAAVVSGSAGSYILSLTGRGADWHGVDLSKVGLGISAGTDYTFTVNGTTSQGTIVKLAQNGGNYTTYASQTVGADGNYSLTFTKAGADITTDIRVQTEGSTPDFTISSIVVTSKPGDLPPPAAIPGLGSVPGLTIGDGSSWAGANLMMGINASQWPFSAGTLAAFTPAKGATYHLSFNVTSSGATGFRVRWITKDDGGTYTQADVDAVNAHKYTADQTASVVPAYFENTISDGQTQTYNVDFTMDGSQAAGGLIGSIGIRGQAGSKAFSINTLTVKDAGGNTLVNYDKSGPVPAGWALDMTKVNPAYASTLSDASAGLTSTDGTTYVPGVTLVNPADTLLAVSGSAFQLWAPTGKNKYKGAKFATGTAAGGTAAQDGFIAYPGLTYTVSFMASVDDSASGQVRFNPNNTSNPGVWPSTATINRTPKLIKFAWTQKSGGGDFLLETGSTAEGNKLSITDLKIEIGDTANVFNPDIALLDKIKASPIYSGYLMGNIINPAFMNDPFMSVLKSQFSVVTPENALKPSSLIGTSDKTKSVEQLNFTEADTELQSAIDNGLLIHGHTLVWHDQSIPWLNNDKISDSDSTLSNPGLTAAGAYANMNDYIKAVLTHFDGKFNASTQNIISWDVVNEAMGNTVRNSNLDPKDWHSYLKSTPWLAATDVNYVEQAFKDARAAEPNYDVLLYYNDFSMDDQTKAGAVRDMVKDINDRWAEDHPGKQLIQGVGLQEHNGLGTNPGNTRKTLQMFKDIGVKVSISELDISAGSGGQQSVTQAQDQAAQYARLMQVYTHPDFANTVQRISIWGLTDTASWHAPESPLLFDGNLYPKDAFRAVINPAEYLAYYAALEHPKKPEGKLATAAKGTPAVDGIMDDIWTTTPSIPINVKQAGNTKTGTIMPAATARMLWDNANLYVFAKVTKDPSEPLDKTPTNAYEQDSFEVVVDLLNGSSSTYSDAAGHYRVRYDGVASVDSGMSDTQGKTTTVTSSTTFDEETNSYTVEMKIPFVQISPEVGTQMGFDVQVNDAKAGSRIGAFAWNDATGTAYQDLFKIGTLQLAAAPSAGPSTGPSTPIIPSEPPIGQSDGKVTITPTVEVKDGKATSSISSSNLNKALELAPVNAQGKKQVTVEIPAQAGSTSYEVKLPTSNLKDSGTTVLSIKTENGTIDLPGNMLSNTDVGNADAVAVHMSKASTAGLSDEIRKQIGDKPVINLEVSVGDKVVAWNNPNVPVTVSVPYKPTAEELSNPDDIIIWYIDGNGVATPVSNARYDAASGTVIFKTTHFSNYAVAFVEKTFEDLASVPWAKQAIESMAARDVIKGISANSFSPAASIKRADFIALLVRVLELKGTGNNEAMFSDVKNTAYYINELVIAKELGITTGYGVNTFKPDSAITRQEMMVLTTRALAAAGKKIAVSGNLDAYADAASISGFAKDSAMALVKSGIVNGKNGKIAPNDSLTRAEAAVILYRIWNL